MSTRKSNSSSNRQKKIEVITFSEGEVRAVVYFGRAQDIGMPYLCYKVERTLGRSSSPSSFFFACHNDAQAIVSRKAAQFCAEHQQNPDGAFDAAKHRTKPQTSQLENLAA